jgi:hypothetical protein
LGDKPLTCGLCIPGYIDPSQRSNSRCVEAHSSFLEVFSFVGLGLKIAVAVVCCILKICRPPPSDPVVESPFILLTLVESILAFVNEILFYQVLHESQIPLMGWVLFLLVLYVIICAFLNVWIWKGLREENEFCAWATNVSYSSAGKVLTLAVFNPRLMMLFGSRIADFLLFKAPLSKNGVRRIITSEVAIAVFKTIYVFNRVGFLSTYRSLHLAVTLSLLLSLFGAISTLVGVALYFSSGNGDNKKNDSSMRSGKSPDTNAVAL